MSVYVHVNVCTMIVQTSTTCSPRQFCGSGYSSCARVLANAGTTCWIMFVVTSWLCRQRKYKKWGKVFPWLEYDDHYQGAFCKICRKRDQHSSQKTGGVWITKSFKKWKKAVEEMHAHAKSDAHIQ